MQKLAIYPWTRGSVVFNMFCTAKSAKKNNFFLRGNFRPLPNKNVQIGDHFFPSLFPKDSFGMSKFFGHPTSGSGGKKTFKWYLKSEQTDTRTFRLIESIGPEGRCFENTLGLYVLKTLDEKPKFSLKILHEF